MGIQRDGERALDLFVLFLKLWRTSVLFVGPLMPLFWT